MAPDPFRLRAPSASTGRQLRPRLRATRRRRVPPDPRPSDRAGISAGRAAPLRAAARVARGPRHRRIWIGWADWSADGRVELLLAGFYEPVLASLPRRDRVEQIQWMREAIRRRFGVDARGSGSPSGCGSPSWPPISPTPASATRWWTIATSWSPAFRSEQLHAPYWTESDGKRVALFPIDERLRYLIPFRPPEETADYLRELRAPATAWRCWPTTARSSAAGPAPRNGCIDQGWLDRFMADDPGTDAKRGEVQLSTLDAGAGARPQRRHRLPPHRLLPGDGGLVAPARRRAPA